MCADRRADAVGGVISADVPTNIECGCKHRSDQEKLNHNVFVMVRGCRVQLLVKLPHVPLAGDTRALEPDLDLVQADQISPLRLRLVAWRFIRYRESGYNLLAHTDVNNTVYVMYGVVLRL